ncbi:HAD family hydrolase [Sphingomonas sp. BIUV-7]|uniref:D,D-heptose 1,7-bisphosphate phosphatase n=1 Tax=Sphingomonas natans TaxID=3063330 RepID=A0ABT8Y7E1_9SPHN|nr:HAD family hydrolase [Sphingomonas sp. BIUV-7]MDO6413654.1 HAD family hydrolase [Sphingomonas sp. BIUV-7]
MSSEAAVPRPAAFLDRDGVINIDNGYTYRPEMLVFTPTAIEAIRNLNQAGYLVIVVTNQSGVARGLYSVSDIERFHEAMQAELRRHGGWIDAFYYCAYHPNGIVAEFAREHEDRKPSPGMLIRAMNEWPIDPKLSFMVGDKDSDVEAAHRAGIAEIKVPANVCDLAATVYPLISKLDRRAIRTAGEMHDPRS